MNKAWCFSFLLLSGYGMWAQDTLVTQYPGTELPWLKVNDGPQKQSEFIYHANDQIWMQVRYEGETERWDWYYDNGQPYFKATIIDNALQGLYQIGYANGQMAEVINFTDHIEDGSAWFYYPNGQLAMTGTYRDGEMMNDWVFYRASGSLADGPWQWLFAADSSRLRMKGEVRNGMMSGTWQYTSIANLGTSSEKNFTFVSDK